MNLRRWDIVFVRENEIDSAGHSGVVLSRENMLEDPRIQRVNILMGSKKSPARSPQPIPRKPDTSF